MMLSCGSVHCGCGINKDQERMFSVQYCVQQLCTVQCTHMNRPNGCLLVRFSFSVVILWVTVYLW